MALICCPKCGESISDKASSCIHCGYTFFDQSANMKIKCADCGTEYEKELSSCPKCGCPNAGIKIESQKPKTKKKAIILGAVILAVLAVVAILGIGALKKAEKEQYYSNMETVTYTMLKGAADAEEVGNLIKSVWCNAIYEERDPSTDKYTMQDGKFVDDFNDALFKLFNDASFTKLISIIEDNQTQVAALMKELRNPPKEYEEAYSVLLIYYDNYLKFTQMVINPTGSLQTFSQEFNASDSGTVNMFEKMQLYLD